MGESRSRRVSNRTSMKTLFFVAALMAMALGAPQQEAESGPNPDAEANPDAWYGYYGYGGYRGYYGGYRPYGYRYYGKRSADAEPTAEAAANPEAEADPWYGYYGYGYYGKRSADAEPTADASADASPEADPWYGYYGYGYRPYGYMLWIPPIRICLLGLSSSQQQLAVSPCRLCCKTPVFAKQFSFCRKIVLFCVLGCRVLCSIICKSTKK